MKKLTIFAILLVTLASCGQQIPTPTEKGKLNQFFLNSGSTVQCSSYASVLSSSGVDGSITLFDVCSQTLTIDTENEIEISIEPSTLDFTIENGNSLVLANRDNVAESMRLYSQGIRSSVYGVWKANESHNGINCNYEYEIQVSSIVARVSCQK
jgi:hypothetical protein